MALKTRARWAYNYGTNVRDRLFAATTDRSIALAEDFLMDPGRVRERSEVVYVLLMVGMVLGEVLGDLRRGHLPSSDRAQGGVMGIVGLLIVLLVAGIVLILGPTILALLTTSLPSTANTTWNDTYTSVADNVDTAFVIGGVLLVIVVIGAMITVLLTSFTGSVGGGRRGGFM